MEINEMTHLLPPISTETEPNSDIFRREEYLDLMAYGIEFQRQMEKENYQGAIDAATRLLDLFKQHPSFLAWKGEDSMAEAHVQRAYAYFMNGDYEAASKDLQWVEAHVNLSGEHQTQKIRGIVEYLAGNGTAALEAAANRGDLMAMLVLNQLENTNPPKTEWLLLSQEDRIQKLIEGKHYAAVIEEINKMPYNRLFSEKSDEFNWLALRGVCHALRGHYELAVEDLDRADQHWFKHYDLEKALVYAQAGHKEDALKILNKAENPWRDKFPVELVRQVIG